MATPTETRPGIAHAEVDAEITKTRGRKKEVVEEGHDVVPVRVQVPANPIHAEVEVCVGATIGMPGFSAARFDVKLRLPCRNTPADVEKTYEAALAFCRKKFDELKGSVA